MQSCLFVRRLWHGKSLSKFLKNFNMWSWNPIELATTLSWTPVKKVTGTFFGPDQVVVLRRRKKPSWKKQTDQSLTLKIREKHIRYHPTLGKNIIFKSSFGWGYVSSRESNIQSLFVVSFRENPHTGSISRLFNKKTQIHKSSTWLGWLKQL